MQAISAPFAGTSSAAKALRSAGRVLGWAFIGFEVIIALEEVFHGEKPKTTSPPIISFTDAEIQRQQDEFLVKLPFTDSSRGHSNIFIRTDSVNNIFANDWKTVLQRYATSAQETEKKVAEIALSASTFNEFYSKVDELAGSAEFIEGVTVYYFAKQDNGLVVVDSSEAEFDPVNRVFTLNDPTLPNGEYKYLILVRFSPALLATGLIDDFSKKTWENNLLRHCSEVDNEKNCGLVLELAKADMVSETEIRNTFEEMRIAIKSQAGFWKNFGNEYSLWYDSLKSETRKAGANAFMKINEGDYFGAWWEGQKTIIWDGLIGGIGALFNSPIAATAAWTAQDNLIEKVNSLEKENFWKVTTVYGVPITGNFTVTQNLEEVTEIPSPQLEEKTVELDGIIVQLTKESWQALSDKQIEPLTINTLQKAMSVTVNGEKKQVQTKMILEKPRIFVAGVKVVDKAKFEFSFTDKNKKEVFFKKEYVIPSKVIWINGWFLEKTPEPVTAPCGKIRECLAAVGKKFSEKLFE